MKKLDFSDLCERFSKFLSESSVKFALMLSLPWAKTRELFLFRLNGTQQGGMMVLRTQGREIGLPEALVESLEKLGGVQFRPVFGAWGLFRQGAMFGWVIEGRCYLRSGNSLKLYAERHQIPPLVRTKPDGSALRLRYYPVHPESLQEPAELMQYLLEAVEKAKQEKKKQEEGKQIRVLAAAERSLKVPAPAFLNSSLK